MGINYKIGTCISCNKEKPIYSKKMCQYCYWTHTNTKAKKKRESKYCTDWGFETEKELFDSLKCVNPHSFILNLPLKNFLGKEWYNCCHHVLPKGKFPLFRLNPANITLLTPEQHTDIHSKTKAQLGDSWASYYTLYFKLLNDYSAFKALRS